jgi:hypothetical protein
LGFDGLERGDYQTAVAEKQQRKKQTTTNNKQIQKSKRKIPNVDCPVLVLAIWFLGLVCRLTFVA